MLHPGLRSLRLFHANICSSVKARLWFRRFSNGATPAPKNEFKFPVWKSLIFTGICGAGLLYYYRLQQARRVVCKKRMETPGVTGAPRLGGHFSLIDQDSKPFDSSALDKFMLVYFGFTHCPDICPEELDRMTEIMNLIETKDKDKIVPVFITIDPSRDGPAQMKEYLKGLTGDEEQVRAIARKYRVYYRPAKTSATTDDYLVDHSIFFFLIGPDGKYVAHFGRETVPQKAAEFISDCIQSWQGEH